MNFSSPRDGISAQFLGLIRALLEHVFALSSLAALETKELLAKVLPSFLLLLLTFCCLFLGYLFLIVALVALAILKYQFSWLIVLGSGALLHIGIAILFIFLLWRQASYSPLPITRLEIQRDLEALGDLEILHKKPH